MVGACGAGPIALSPLPFVRACVLADAHDCGALPALPGEVDVLTVGPGCAMLWTQLERRVQRSSEPPVTAPHPPPRYRGLVYGMVALLHLHPGR